ncbi:hypothetical protein CLOM_g7483 [Closterium sp. NIES-68]|nr:hypothetical protein CLOM_g7483 [Closterium sp. NIES-68]GJP87006.1 hypothetical protein CLOP_g16978 [Closterium sp. NIES-67]
MNELNLKFQKQEVDVTEITQDVDEAVGDLRHHYLECGGVFGAGVSGTWLSAFLTVYGRGGAKRVKVRGVDKDGQPVTHTYQMHERQIKGHVYQRNYRDCELLCAKFARGSMTNLLERLDDLLKLGPTKLFRAGKWPRLRMVRGKKTREYLHGCSAIFDDRLPGFDLKEVEKELATWAPIMQNHHNEEGFYQGLTNYLGNTESSRRWPNLMLL